MTSVLSRNKQAPLNAGFYITLGAISTVSYSLGTSTEVAPTFTAVTAVSLGGAGGLGGLGALTALGAAGAILRDEGKTLRSANRIFRKVQLLVSTGSILSSGSDGVAGSAASTTVTNPFLSFYVELPGGGNNGVAGNTANSIANIARLG